MSFLSLRLLEEARDALRLSADPLTQQRIIDELTAAIKILKVNPEPETESYPVMFSWVVRLSVADTWVADGFQATNERVRQMLEHDLRYAYGGELRGEVLMSPPDEEVAKAQGYKTVEAWRNRDRLRRQFPLRAK